MALPMNASRRFYIELFSIRMLALIVCHEVILLNGFIAQLLQLELHTRSATVVGGGGRRVAAKSTKSDRNRCFVVAVAAVVSSSVYNSPL